MKRVTILSVILTLSIAVSGLCAQDAKRYEVKSGIITYAISGGGNIMGVKSQTQGKETIVFKEWGSVALETEESTTTMMGQTEQKREMRKYDKGTVYAVNFKKKKIVKISIAMMKGAKDKELMQMGKKMMEAMGGKKVGQEKILGYTCEIWEVMGTRTWIHKGIALKTEANIMGMRHTKVATDVQFNVSVPDSKFTLPNYPIITRDQMLNEMMGGQGGGQPEKMPKMTPEQMKKMREMMQRFGQ